jgi:hypothetical protein
MSVWLLLEHIESHILEAKAVLYALDLLATTDTDPNINYRYQFRIDNTTAIAVIQKQYSKAFALNEVVRMIAHHPLRQRITTIDYVATSVNKADWLSRIGWRDKPFLGTSDATFFDRSFHSSQLRLALALESQVKM